MKTVQLLSAFALASISTWTAAQTAPATTCETKREAISHDIDAAKAKGQGRRVAGLERALKENRRTCSDVKLRAERARDIAAQEKVVERRRRDLQVAEEQGKPSKITSRRNKLEEETAKLQRMKDTP
jgi:uncharacterized protein YijF (DUF1287 family)